MALFKHAGGFADRFSIKDETTWAESRNSNVEKETDHFLMEMAQLGAKSFTKLVSEYLKRPGLGSSHLPKNLPALQRKLALDPSWGTYNPGNSRSPCYAVEILTDYRELENPRLLRQ